MNTKLIAGAATAVVVAAAGGVVMLTTNRGDDVSATAAAAVTDGIADSDVHIHEDGSVHYHTTLAAADADTTVAPDGSEPEEAQPVEPPPGAPQPTYIEQGDGAAFIDGQEVAAPQGAVEALAADGITATVLWTFESALEVTDEVPEGAEVTSFDSGTIGGFVTFDPATGEAHGRDFVRYNPVTFESVASEWVLAKGQTWQRPVPVGEPAPWEFGTLEGVWQLDRTHRDANALLNLLLNGGNDGEATVTTDGTDRPAEVTVTIPEGTFTMAVTYDSALTMPQDRPLMSMSDDQIDEYVNERYSGVHVNEN